MTTFAIAMFILVMKMLWHYIDKIAGKGLSLFQIVELIAYKSASLIQLALPLSILVSSVMVIGALAEHYELNSFKSAGVSLVRIMRPLLIFGCLGATTSFLANDYLIPAANIQFAARMYDIQQKKPTLNLEPGTFNEDFNNYAILIGNKAKNGQSIGNIQIYDHAKANAGQVNQITAKAGEMYTANNGAVLVMELRDGNQYAESKTSLDHSQSNREYPFVRTAFKKYNKVFDLNEFKLSVSDPSLFDQKRSMLTTTQLMSAIDSIDLVIQSQKQSINQYLPTTLTNKKKPHREDLSANQMPSSTQDNWPGLKILFQQLNKAEQASTIKRGRAQIRTILAQLKRLKHSIPEATESRVKHAYALQMKYSMALVCIIFVLIGASMGAIVRKGDFGYPILVSIIFFILFIVLTIFCRKLAEAFVLHEIAAGWMPCIILFPIGLWLTFMAKNDRELNIISIFQGVYDRITKLALLHKTNMSPPPDAK